MRQMHDNPSRDDTEDRRPVDDACKVFINRIPSSFTEETLTRLVESVTGEQDSIMDVGMTYEETDPQAPPSKHKGFAFMVMKTKELASLLIRQQTLKGGAKPNSKKKHTMYLSAVSEDRDVTNFACFLWKQKRCPYGDNCKFQHTGEGACLHINDTPKTVRKTKCWEFMKKGSCKEGDACPFLHVEKETEAIKERSDSEKDCISWKTKGKCRKRDTCPYRHDEGVREKVLAKKQKRQMATDSESAISRPQKKPKQPLSVRVFGMNYETTEPDVREFFSGCGKIKDITFPIFEDSGRSKGYCEVLFTSPKAVQQAVLLHESELQGRWLSIQSGKMLEEQWQNRSAAASKYERTVEE